MLSSTAYFQQDGTTLNNPKSGFGRIHSSTTSTGPTLEQIRRIKVLLADFR